MLQRASFGAEALGDDRCACAEEFGDANADGRKVSGAVVILGCVWIGGEGHSIGGALGLRGGRLRGGGERGRVGGVGGLDGGRRTGEG